MISYKCPKCNKKSFKLVLKQVGMHITYIDINGKKIYGDICPRCRNASARVYMSKRNKTKAGFMRVTYGNMRNRILGKNSKTKGYIGLSLLNAKDFYEWTMSNKQFNKLFNKWTKNRYLHKLVPSIDRINPEIGYEITNMQWLTLSENSLKTRPEIRGRRGSSSWQLKQKDLEVQNVSKD